MALVLFLLILGTVGYSIIEDWSPLDALYMTIITMTTVGFGEVHELSPHGRQFTIVLVMVSVAAGALALAALTSFVVEGHLQGAIRERRRKQVLSKLNDHIVVCGFGRVGQAAARAVGAASVPFVVVSEDLPERMPWEIADAVVIKGDATSREALFEAGAHRAKGIVCALDSDANNLMLVLTLAEIAPSATVVARAADEQAEHLMLRAGADVVMSPYRQAGERLANALLRPGVHSFLEVVTAGGAGHLRLREAAIEAGSPLIGCSLAELAAVRESSARVVGIAKPWGEAMLNPTGSTMLAEGDRLIVAGTEEQIDEFLDVLQHEN